jgi:hypothetical protein
MGPMMVRWFSLEGEDLGVGSVESAPRSAAYYEYVRNGVTVSRRAGYRPESPGSLPAVAVTLPTAAGNFVADLPVAP